MLINPLKQTIDTIFGELATMTSGTVASYIPELAKANPDHLAIAIVTTDGATHVIGDWEQSFTIQSMSKPFAYAAALDRLGRAKVLEHVGVEPTGEAFNAIVLDEYNNRPFNPMVNAGAIAVAALYEGENAPAKTNSMIATLSRFAGQPLAIDERVYHSEASTGHRNRAIAYLMLNSGMLASSPEDALDTYFRQCSVLVNTSILATMAATLANGGINPKTGVRAISGSNVPDVLTLMLTCGMYDYAGQWAYEVGLPAKSGVSGGVVAVVPGQFGIAVYSPRLDRFGNSVRGVAACQRLSQTFSLHSFRTRPDADGTVRREISGKYLRSLRTRSDEESAVLERSCDRVTVLEIAGDLFTGAAERIIRRINALFVDGRDVILDVRRVRSLDGGTERLFSEFIPHLSRFSRHLTIVGESTALIRRWSSLEAAADSGRLMVTDSIDVALEQAEERLLAEAGVGREAGELPVISVNLFKSLSPTEFSTFHNFIKPERVVFAAGETIVRQHDPALHFFTIASGTVLVQIRTESGKCVRLAALGPGVVFGEMALFDDATRSADVVAETDAACWRMDIATLKLFGEKYPAIMNRILVQIINNLSGSLRRATGAISALSG